ncbi:hypothetical protein E6B08_17705 [Pseudomonas putida]|uniref:Uncharacterized protein n=1 Tax=Pseudomonas putida TaxID=303 RepID=A0A4D6XBE4_PSEPU|nr:hypothetical protein [Pseudomonas putida]QCI13093.1 hypothetical protein E6B08_17705 [Pseudomonas putida]
MTLDAKAAEALSRYREALSAFQAVGHGTDEGADLYLSAERAAEDFGRQIAVLAAKEDKAKLDELAACSPDDHPGGSADYWRQMDELGKDHMLSQKLNLIDRD